MGYDKAYELKESIQDHGIKYFFVSTGAALIIKAIEYQYIQEFDGCPLYNLGFGDYDIKIDEISDQTMSNNGDSYLVFHTVLSTIPKFFKLKPLAVLMVQGSDSSNEFIENCRKSCENQTNKLGKISEKDLLSLVSSKLEHRVLFPQKLEDAKKYLKNVRIIHS